MANRPPNKTTSSPTGPFQHEPPHQGIPPPTRSRRRLSEFLYRNPSAQGYQRLPEEYPPLAPRPSIVLPQLQDSEKKFFDLVGYGDVGVVKQFLQENEEFNINCINFQGISALHIAVQNHNEPMVEFLLTQPNIYIGDCILHAVRENQRKILQLLLDKLQEVSPGLEFEGVTHSSDFPDHVTPLILAAQCGHYEIIEMLIGRGHQIIKPHPPDCMCTECKIKHETDDLLHAETHRLNLYRAVTNPAYICHSSHDPILTAFELSHELRKCAKLVIEFRAAYNELAEEIGTFAVELIGCCRSTGEMELILRQKAGLFYASQHSFPRLVLAMDYKQKAFVAHPNTQQILETAWHGDWIEWKLKSWPIRLVYPVYRLKYNGTALEHTDKQNDQPQLIVHPFSDNHFFRIEFGKSWAKTFSSKFWLEPIIMLYVFGYIWSSCRLIAIQGPARHFKQLWNCHNVIMYFLFVCTFIFWLASLLDVKANDQADLERKYWFHLDPVLLSEGTFAIATIMAYFKLLHLCRLNYYLGPLQISLGKMSADIAKYIGLFTIVILSFSVGLCTFYQYYSGMVQTDEASGIKTAQQSSFVDFRSTLKTFFWALFCMSALESADVIIENLPGESEGTTIINKHVFTETVGYIAFALFEVLTVIILLNMLIATMSNTFQRVNDNSDVEWTFGRTEFYLEYILQTTLPSPFNLIPTANGLSAVAEWIHVLYTKPSDKLARFSIGHCCYIENEADESLCRDFPILMSQLIQRYFREKDSTAEAADLENIKQELSEIRQITIASNKLQMQSCAKKIMAQIFNKDSTVINVFIEENIISNISDHPYIVFNASEKIIGVIKNYENNFILQANTIPIIIEMIFNLLYNNFETRDNIRMGRFLIITRLKDPRQLFYVMWYCHIPHVVVLCYDDTEKNEDLDIYIANPHCTENKCGSATNKVELHKCNSDDAIAFPKTILKYGFCPFLFGWPGDSNHFNNKSRTEKFIKSTLVEISRILHAKITIVSASEENNYNLSVKYLNYFFMSLFNMDTDFGRTKIFFHHDIVWFGTKAEKCINTFFNPFCTETWVLIFVVFVLVLLTWWRGLLLENLKNYKVQTFFQSFSQIASLLFGVSIPMTPKLVCLKILVLFYFIYIIHIQTAYTSDMINNLVVPSYKNVINNVYDLADSDLPIFVDRNFSDELFYADTENFSLYSKIKNKVITYQDSKEVQNSNYKNFFVITLNILYALRSKDKIKKIRNTFTNNDVTGNIKLSFFSYKNPTMVSSINKAITFIQEFGFDQKAYREWYRYEDASKISELVIHTYEISESTDWAEPLRFKDFVGVLIVFGLGSLTSISILFMEILIKKYKLKLDACFNLTLSSYFTSQCE
ncbi:hypothetical protein FQR65_LT01105 [Abscondita terminalis]|nr:hypothetical protein FQR65_LT01105 [Abscondita terminalis]